MFYSRRGQVPSKNGPSCLKWNHDPVPLGRTPRVCSVPPEGFPTREGKDSASSRLIHGFRRLPPVRTKVEGDLEMKISNGIALAVAVAMTPAAVAEIDLTYTGLGPTQWSDYSYDPAVLWDSGNRPADAAGFLALLAFFGMPSVSIRTVRLVSMRDTNL